MNEKERSSNFDKKETEKLSGLIKKYNIITCKKTDHASVQQKDTAWKLLVDEFNQDATQYRSQKQLQYKFNNLKKRARSEMVKLKTEMRKTGGGPPPPKPSSPTEWLNSIMGDSISGRASIYDSDTISASQPISQENTSEVKEIDDIVVIPAEQVMSSEFDDDNDNSKPIESDCETQKPLSKQLGSSITTFDSTTPKTMLRKLVSKELAVTKKRKYIDSPQETRRKIISLTNKKEEWIEKKKNRENIMSKCIEEEHRQNIAHKEQLHQMEVEFKKKLYDLSLQKAEVELEIEKEKLKSLKGCFLVSLFRPSSSTST